MATLGEFSTTDERGWTTPAIPAGGYVATLSIYAAAHFVVDTCCAATVFSVLPIGAVPLETFAALLLLYHVIAFGLQSLLGLFVDATGMPRAAAVVGGLVSAVALLVPAPITAIVVTSLGNALFHVGGGVICLRAAPHRAAPAGFFVAPGAFGLLLGTILGKSGMPVAVPLLAAAAVVCLLMACTPEPHTQRTGNPRVPSGIEPILAFVLLAVTVRSVLGFLISFPWEAQPAALLALTAATVFGKAIGGVLADRWGWMRVAVGSLLAALPFLVCGPMVPLAAIPGIFLLNMTMPITLAAVSESLPGHPGFAFGLTTLALLLGEIPFFLGATIGNPIFVLLMILLSLAGLYNGLRLLAVSPSFRKAVRA